MIRGGNDLSHRRGHSRDLDGDSDLDYVWLQGVAVFAPFYPLPTWYWLMKTAMNESILPGHCAPAGAAPTALIGQPSPGNQSFFLALSGAPPGAAAAVAVSSESGSFAVGGCLIAPSLDPAHLILPAGPLGLMNVNGSGVAYFPAPLPIGLPLYDDFYLQWIVADPAGLISLGGSSYSLSPARKFLIW